ncbi:50S ribosomal protein L11 methyltransferase [Rickettsiales bacterium]|nr:50S ribosomal protein L11 methyltransferase [Rickettsiales bacterium]
MKQIPEVWKAQISADMEDIHIFMDALEDLSDSLSCFEDENSDKWILCLYSQTEFTNQLNAKLALAAELSDVPEPELTITPIEYHDWVKESQENFSPINVENFYIHPSWNEDFPDDENIIKIQVDPEQAFGTGGHYTTYGCLQALSYLNNIAKPTKILDMGCGSGILAIAAAKLWTATNIDAADNDPVCVEISDSNANKNGVKIRSFLADGYKSQKIDENKPYDLIISNILARPLIDFAEDAINCLNQGGYIILSGLLDDQEESVKNAYIKNGLKTVQRFENQEWPTLILQKP